MAVLTVDATIERAKRIKSRSRENSDWHTRDFTGRGISVRIATMMYHQREQQCRRISRDWVAKCRTPAVVAYINRRLAELMRELNGVILGPDGEPINRPKK